MIENASLWEHATFNPTGIDAWLDTGQAAIAGDISAGAERTRQPSPSDSRA
jgi:hypothetical protein